MWTHFSVFYAIACEMRILPQVANLSEFPILVLARRKAECTGENRKGNAEALLRGMLNLREVITSI